MDARCAKCKRLEYACTCRCSICDISLYDKRRVIRVSGKTVELSTDNNGNIICNHCMKCFHCEIPRYDGAILQNGKFIFGSGDNVCRLKWFCPKSDCIAAIKTDPWTVANEKRHKEREKRRANEEFCFDGRGTNNRPTILGPKIKLLMCPELFDLNPNSNIVTNMISCYRFSKMIYHVIFEKNEKKISFDGRNISGLSEKFKEYFALSVARIEDSRIRRRESLEKKARLRAEKYPDEIPEPMPARTLPENEISIHSAFNILCIEQRCFTGTVQIDDWKSILYRDIEACTHFNASLWYYCGRILNDQTIDGFQDRLIVILKRWWELGLYPEGRTDYLDITNLFIKSQLTREVKITNANNTTESTNSNNNSDNDDLEFDEESECIICYGNFPKRLIELKPCKHRNYCKECSLKISKCSLCNTIISERIQHDI